MGVLAIAGWALRAAPLVRSAGLGYPVDYDEGVYFASAALLLRGVFPYRDFVFVHPPGLLYALLPTAGLSTWLDPATALAVARWVSTLIGGANIILAGRIGARIGGPLGGVVAAALYAVDPEVGKVERGVFLEPLLNLTCLGLCSLWLNRKLVLAGILCGVALSVKLWGVLWLVACLLSLSPERWREQVRVLLLAALGTWALLVLPLAAMAPQQIFEQGIFFHLHRPPDGTPERLARLAEMLVNRGRFAVSGLVAVGLVAIVLRRGGLGSTAGRFLAIIYVLLLVALCFPTAYWIQYNSHLAVPASLLAGLGASVLWRWFASRQWSWARLAMLLLLLAGPYLLARQSLRIAQWHSPGLVALGQFVRRSIPPDAYLFSFDPAWTIVGGRFPSVRGSSAWVDPYAEMLLESVRSGRRYIDANAAFLDPDAQARLRTLLDSSQFVAVGELGRRQLSPDTLGWLREHFAQVFQSTDNPSFDVWGRSR